MTELLLNLVKDKFEVSFNPDKNSANIQIVDRTFESAPPSISRNVSFDNMANSVAANEALFKNQVSWMADQLKDKRKIIVDATVQNEQYKKFKDALADAIARGCAECVLEIQRAINGSTYHTICSCCGKDI